MTEKQRLINELLEHNFECEAGPLANSITFKDLKRIIDEEASQEGKQIVGGIMPELERPICFLDLETTGVDTDHSFICEITVLKIDKDGNEDLTTMLINPGVPIPKDATDVHGITDEMVKDKPIFASVSKNLLKYIEDCDIAGFNSNSFDVPMLVSMFSRVGLKLNWKNINLIDVRNIFVINEERTLSAGVKFYLNRDHSEAHSAEADVLATRDILVQQMAKYDLTRDMKELALYSNYGREFVDLSRKFVKNEKGEIVFNFGSHMGKVATTEKKYLQWMIEKGDFTADTKDVANILSFQ